MSLFERIKNIRRNNLQEEKMKFPGGTGDIGFNAPKRREKVQKRLSRADDVYGTPDPFDPDYDKKVKKVDGRTKTGKVFKSTKPVTTSAPGFGKGLTPGEIRVKGLERKAFKKTQPSDIKKTKGYKRYAQLSKEIKKYKSDVQDFKDRNLPGGPRKTSRTSFKGQGSGSRFDPGIGMAPPDKPKTKVVKQSEVSKKAKDFTKNVDAKRFMNTYGKKGSATNPEISGIDFEKTPSSVRSKVNTGRPKVTKNYTRKNKGFTTPAKTKTSKPSFDISGTKYSPLKEPELPKFVTAKGDASFSKTGAGKGAIRIQKGATRSDINILRAGQKIAKKSGPAKGLVKTGSKILSKLGPKGRLAGLALTGFAASPFGRKTIGTLATAGGLTALFGGGKKEKQLKVGDGLKNVGKVRVTADSKGLKRNEADMAKIKATQKNFIDKYNKGRAFGKIKYNVNKQGTYDVIKPKKK